MKQTFSINESIIDFVNITKIEDNQDYNEFNPYSRPPNLKYCYMHERASKVTKPRNVEKDNPNDFCPCCGNPSV